MTKLQITPRQALFHVKECLKIEDDYSQILQIYRLIQNSKLASESLSTMMKSKDMAKFLNTHSNFLLSEGFKDMTNKEHASINKDH